MPLPTGPCALEQIRNDEAHRPEGGDSRRTGIRLGLSGLSDDQLHAAFYKAQGIYGLDNSVGYNQLGFVD